MILIPIDISDLEEAALPLDKYASLRDFFIRALKEGSRPIDADPQCLVTGNSYLEISNIFICTIFSRYMTCLTIFIFCRLVLWMVQF